MNPAALSYPDLAARVAPERAHLTPKLPPRPQPIEIRTRERLYTLRKGQHQITLEKRDVPTMGEELILSVNGEWRRMRVFWLLPLLAAALAATVTRLEMRGWQGVTIRTPFRIRAERTIGSPWRQSGARSGGTAVGGDSAMAAVERSTRPRTVQGKARSARNADRGWYLPALYLTFASCQAGAR
jgi:hypothetical protein